MAGPHIIAQKALPSPALHQFATLGADALDDAFGRQSPTAYLLHHPRLASYFSGTIVPSSSAKFGQ